MLGPRKHARYSWLALVPDNHLHALCAAVAAFIDHAPMRDADDAEMLAALDEEVARRLHERAAGAAAGSLRRRRRLRRAR